MSRAVLVLASDAIREKAIGWIRKAPKDTRVEFQGPKRSPNQNDRMWVLLTAVADQLVWHGNKYRPEEWKDFFMHMYAGESFMPDEDGNPTVRIGRSTSRLSVQEHTDLTKVIEVFCAVHNIDIGENDG